MAVLSFPKRKTVSIISSSISACFPSATSATRLLIRGSFTFSFITKPVLEFLANRPSLSGSR